MIWSYQSIEPGSPMATISDPPVRTLSKGWPRTHCTELPWRQPVILNHTSRGPRSRLHRLTASTSTRTWAVGLKTWRALQRKVTHSDIRGVGLGCGRGAAVAGGAKVGHGLGVGVGALVTTHSELRSTSTVAVGVELLVGVDGGIGGCGGRGACGWR